MQPITIGMYIRGFAMGGPTPPPQEPMGDFIITEVDNFFMITEDGDNMIKE